MRVYKNVWPNHKLSARHSLQIVKSKKLDIPYKYNQKKAEIDPLRADKMGFEIKGIMWDRKGHFVTLSFNLPRWYTHPKLVCNPEKKES